MRQTLMWGGHRLYAWFAHRRLASWYARLVQFAPPGPLLDVGCGPGHLATSAAKTRDVVGADLDPVQTRLARRRGGPRGPHWVTADAARLPFREGTFQTVTATETLHHWKDVGGGLDEARRVLRPDGQMWIIEGCADMHKEELAAWSGHVRPGETTGWRLVFRRHGYSPSRLEKEVVAAARRAFAHGVVERVAGWWVVRASSAPVPARHGVLWHRWGDATPHRGSGAPGPQRAAARS